MPDRVSPRAVLAVLLLLLTIAGIGAAGPAVGLHRPPRPVLLATGAALEAVLAGLFVALRWRAGPAVGVGARLRPLLSGVLVTVLIAVPVATLMGSIGKIRRLRPIRHDHLGSAAHPARPHVVRARPDAVGVAVGHDVLIGLLIAAIALAAILIWRRRRAWARLARRDDLAEEETGTPADPATAARAVGSARLALRDLDDARAAIIACYLAMEESLAEAGAGRGAAETPDELLARAVAAGLVSAAPAARLTALFYEARFSTHPMPAHRRDEAERALADLAATLPDPAAPDPAAPEPSAPDRSAPEPAATAEADR